MAILDALICYIKYKLPQQRKSWHREADFFKPDRWQSATPDGKITIWWSNPCYVYCPKIRSKHARGQRRSRPSAMWSTLHRNTARRRRRNTDALKFICADISGLIRLKPRFQDRSQINLEHTRRMGPVLLFTCTCAWYEALPWFWWMDASCTDGAGLYCAYDTNNWSITWE